MTSASLSLLVLRCRDLERSLAFYSALGLTFAREQHGAGVVHHAATLEGDVVLELYPLRGDELPSPIRLGLRLVDVRGAIDALVALGLVSSPTEARSSGRVVVVDPDGNALELT